MDPIIWAAIIGAVVSIGSLIVNGVSHKQTEDQNQANQETQWQREDNEMQRGLADATAAGFSPSAVLGNSWQSSLSTQHQAFNIDPSSLTSTISSAGSQLSRQKQQQPLIDAQVAYQHEQNRSVNLDNQLKEATLNTNKLKNTAELTRLWKELDEMDLSNAQRAAYLVEAGVSPDTIDTMLNYRNGEWSATDLHDNLVKADLANKKADTDLKASQQSLVDAQKSLEDINKNWTESEYKEWSEDDYSKARRAVAKMQQAISDEEAFLSDTHQAALKERQEFSIPVSVDDEGRIVYRTKFCSYAAYLNYWRDFTARSGNYFSSSTSREIATTYLNTLFNGVNSAVNIFAAGAGATTNRINADTNRINAGTNRMNAETNRFRAWRGR